MGKSRLLPLCLALALLCACLPAKASEPSDWLIPKTRDYRAFTDTAGTICESAAATCCETGLMDGVDSRHFLPENGLTAAQIIVISARLHRLLSGGSLVYFEPISQKGAGWWTPYDGYLRSQVPALEEAEFYSSLYQAPTAFCRRETFFRLLAAVLEDTGTVLPEKNSVFAVPDCDNQDILRFYRWGILGGKDAYGTLAGDAALSRAAAAALLARLIDPGQRLELELKQLELCQELLGVDPETVLLTLDGQAVTAEEFMPTLVGTVSAYNHSRFGSMALEQSGRTEVDEAVDALRRQVLCQTLAQELELNITPSNTLYFDGYQGLTAVGQSWREYHQRLSSGVSEALGKAPFPQERLPGVKYAGLWDTLPFSDLFWKVAALPYWGGTF